MAAADSLKVFFLIVAVASCCWAWIGASDYGKVLLRDVQVLTLKEGKLTTGRRSTPIPQLTCVGGSAASSRHFPKAVQCYNRGWDGQDVQWECKANLDGRVQFGQVEVVCEGYDYPEDPYVTKGSCGLEYTLELSGAAGEDGSSRSWTEYNFGSYSGRPIGKWSGVSDLIVLGVICIVIYAFYKTCISQSIGDRQYSSTSDDYPSGGGGGGGGFGGGGGSGGWFWPNNSGRQGFDESSDSCGRGAYRRGTGSGSAGGGFWTGMATGGLLGYMFGNRGERSYGSGRNYYGGGSPMSGTRNAGYSGGSSFGSSSSTTSASGFGGTRRR